MKASRRIRNSSSASSTTQTITRTFRNDNSTPPQPTQIPIKSPPPADATAAAAAKIQAAYRASVVRTLVRKISAVKSATDRLEKLIQRQETVDLVRRSEKEKIRINEELMGLLLELDSVPGFDQGVRELRRNLSRRIVGLQEVMDGICCREMMVMMEMNGWDWNWDDVMGLGRMEEEVCRERGGEELERFCELNLGFRCLQRFLQGQ